MSRNAKHKKALHWQKVAGLFCLIFCAVIVALGATGVEIADQDCTAVFVLAPIGLALTLSRHVILE